MRRVSIWYDITGWECSMHHRQQRPPRRQQRPPRLRFAAAAQSAWQTSQTRTLTAAHLLFSSRHSVAIPPPVVRSNSATRQIESVRPKATLLRNIRTRWFFGEVPAPTPFWVTPLFWIWRKGEHLITTRGPPEPTHKRSYQVLYEKTLLSR